MSLANDLDRFIRTNETGVFIEAEGRPSRLRNFFLEYNSCFSPMINENSDGIIVLEDNANKWGLELRLYLNHRPDFIATTRNTVYRPEYCYRINDVNIILELFTLGYRIGLN